MLLKHEDYTNSVEMLWTDRNKFKRIDKDPTRLRLNTIQNYVNKLFDNGEINEEQKKLMRSKVEPIGRAYGLPKTHKPFQHISKSRPIIDTINTPFHGIWKFLTSLLNPSAQNEYIVKDSFEAGAKINSISFGDISDEYSFVSFDVESLFSDVPLKKTIEIILNRVKKGPLMANVLMTELERVVVKDVFNKGYLKFCIRFMDDTLVLMKKSDVPVVLQVLNGFHKNLNFTVDTFENKKSTFFRSFDRQKSYSYIL